MQERKNLDYLNNFKTLYVLSITIFANSLIAQVYILNSSDSNIIQEKFQFLSADHIHGRFVPDSSIEFTKIDSQYCFKEIYMITEAYEAFVRMAESAKEDSVFLKIISATRIFEDQKFLWENKWTGKTKVNGKKLNLSLKNPLLRAKKILEYTAPPGFSRHHWGTDIDINSVEDEYFDTEEGIKVYSWLQKNASSFGFCQTYTPKEDRHNKGFNEEKWHWSYSKLSEPILNELVRSYNPLELKEFSGYQSVRKLNLLDEYILSINHCQ